MTLTTTDVLREEGTFNAPATSPGVTFHRASFRPTEKARNFARLAIVHGYGDHAGRFVEPMTWWAARGVACHAFDLRGHGRSSGRRGFVRRWAEYLADLDAFLALPELSESENGNSPATPLFVLGHSHGGLVAAAAGVRGLLARHGVAGVILSAPYFVNCLHVPRHKLAAAHVANVVCPWLRIPSGVRPEMMSADAERVADSKRDPLLLRRATPRWFLTHRPVQAEVLARAGAFTTPLLVLQGDADPIADPRGATEFHRAAGSTDKEIITYPGLRHEVLRETGRERVFADVLGWLEQRVKAKT
jgi:alpha-beta hydrolase superfamily lysophospholipase